jgi:hypothetical protein
VRFLRVAWVVLAVIVLGLDAAGIPYRYIMYESVCIRGAEVWSEDSLLTPEGAQELGELGLSRSFYAAYQGVGVETVLTLVCFAVAAVIFLRRSDDRMALFASFVLMIFGRADGRVRFPEIFFRICSRNAFRNVWETPAT